MAKDHFPKVREARELLLSIAKDRIEKQIALIARAEEAGEWEAALKANQWLLEHITGVMDPSVDSKHEIQGTKGPQIQIGIALGGVGQKALPSGDTVEAEVIKDE